MRQLALLIAAGLFPFPLYASSFAYEDLASYPRYRVVLTENRIAESDILDNFDKHGSSSTSSALSIRQQFLNVNPGMSKKNERSVVMMSAHGQPFECTIPDDDNDNSDQSQDTSSTTPSEQDSIERGLKLLEPLSKQNCLYYQTPGYWTYEYCHDKHVRQFHLDRNALQGDQRQITAASNSPSFYLGFYSPSSIQQQQQQQKTDLASPHQHQHYQQPITSLRHVGDQRYLVQQWTGGTQCDLTGKPRSIEIQFHCDMQANDRISMFQEVATCQYQMTITTPRLCEEMMLASTSHSDVNKIECNPIVPDHLVEDSTTTAKASNDEPTTEDSSPVSEEQATTTTTTTTADTATTTMTWQDPSTSNQASPQPKPLDMSKESLLDAVSDLKAQLEELRQQVQQQQRHDRSGTTLSQLEHLLRGAAAGAAGGEVAGDDGEVEFLVYHIDENGELVSSSGDGAGGLDQLFAGQQQQQQGDEGEEKEEEDVEEGSQKQNRRAYDMRYL